MSRPLHVVFVNPYGYELFEPSARASRVYGGAEVQLYYLATGLAAMPGIRVSMVVERPQRGRLRDRIDGVTMSFVRPSRALDWVRLWVPVPAIRYVGAIARSHADVVVQRGGAVLTMDAALGAARRRVPFVFMTAHDWDCTRQHQAGGQRLTGRSYLWALGRAAVVIAQTDDQAMMLRRWHGIGGPVLRSGLPAVAETSPLARADSVLWVGRCVGWKQPLAFLELAAMLPHRTFTMVCPEYGGSPELARQVRERAAALPNLELLEFVRFRDIDELFRSASVFVNTSTAEGFPNTFMQATRAGTPVASLTVNADRVVDAHGLGVVGDDSIDLLACRIDALLSDDTQWHRFSQTGQRYFAARHDLNAVLADLVRLLREAAQNG
ncbi:MAG: glycosyltransferase family 4 protein [Dermatophilaceae bacterium]